MDSRKMLEQHIYTLSALMRGGIKRGVGKPGMDEGDDLQASLQAQWETERNILRRVLAEPGEPIDRLHEWRERTVAFVDKYPERAGWTDREGIEWNAQGVLDAIDKLLEQIEAWEAEAEEFIEDEEEW